MRVKFIFFIIYVGSVRVDYPSVAPSGSPKKMDFFGKILIQK